MAANQLPGNCKCSGVLHVLTVKGSNLLYIFAGYIIIISRPEYVLI
jgi:hypothetical protein